MARDFNLTKPLTKADVKWLKARYPASYVDRMVGLAGTVAEEPENGPETPENSDPAPSAPEGDNGPENGGEGGDEDLIGDVTDFDPGQHTVDEVLAHLKDASDEEKSRVLALEKDGKGRSGILNA